MVDVPPMWQRGQSSSDYDYSMRLRRALTERIYVVGHEPDRARFWVQGATNTTYEILLLPMPVCTCPDFVWRGNGKPCKHIINVVVRALQLPPDILETPFHPRFYCDEVVKALARFRHEWSPNDNQEPATRDTQPANPESTAPAKNDTDCCVCFETFDDANCPWTCVGCGHRIHDECWRRWKSRSSTCPFCRRQY